MDLQKWVHANTMHRILGGSRLYGTDRPDSDYDIRGVCLMPPESLLGLTPFDQYQTTVPDVTIYGLTRFFRLSLDNNPNILDILCAPPNKWLEVTGVWLEIYDHRSLFLSQKLRYTFSGYAIAQLKRLQGHRQWLLSPPDHAPAPEEFEGWIEQSAKGGQKTAFPSDVQRGRYEKAKNHWQQYQTWLTQRNPKRAELERKFGFDVKHACHLVRLMLKAEEVLSTGTYSPVLYDHQRELVQDVLDGRWEYETLIRWASEMDEKVRDMPSALPRRASFKEAEELLMRLNRRSLP